MAGTSVEPKPVGDRAGVRTIFYDSGFQAACIENITMPP
jgi:hypothetical protein